jgi:hypothetical protein
MNEMRTGVAASIRSMIAITIPASQEAARLERGPDFGMGD